MGVLVGDAGRSCAMRARAWNPNARAVCCGTSIVVQRRLCSVGQNRGGWVFFRPFGQHCKAGRLQHHALPGMDWGLTMRSTSFIPTLSQPGCMTAALLRSCQMAVLVLFTDDAAPAVRLCLQHTRQRCLHYRPAQAMPGHGERAACVFVYCSSPQRVSLTYVCLGHHCAGFDTGLECCLPSACMWLGLYHVLPPTHTV